MAETVEFVRENRLGMKYLIREVSSREVIIQLHGTEKAYSIKVSMQVILAAWYKWQILDQFIQEAFSFLDDNAREFILSGLMPGEWNKIFGEIEEKG